MAGRLSKPTAMPAIEDRIYPSSLWQLVQYTPAAKSPAALSMMAPGEEKRIMIEASRLTVSTTFSGTYELLWII